MMARTLVLAFPQETEWQESRMRFQQLPGVRLLGPMDAIEDLVPLVVTSHPEIAFIATTVHGVSTLSAVTELRQQRPQTRLFLVAARANWEELQAAVRLGVAGYLLRDELAVELLNDCLAGGRSSTGLLVSRGVILASTTWGALPLRVLLAVGRGIAGVGLGALLARDSRFTVVALTEQLTNVVTLLRRRQPNLLVLDPARNGRLDQELIAQVTTFPDLRVCLYTGVTDPAAFVAAMKAGVAGYLRQGSLSGEALLEELLAVGRGGGVVIDPSIIAQLRQGASVRLILPTPAGARPVLPALEQTILARLADGETSQTIARALGLSQRSVEHHITRLSEQFEARGRTHLIAIAFRLGMLDH